MRIEVKGRKVAVSDELQARIERRFEKIAKQVSPLAKLEVELSETENPAEPQVVTVTLHLKGATLRARESSTTMVGAINACSDDLARQVKRRKEKQQKRRQAARPEPNAAQA